jgi:hypothetical protein
MATSEMGSQSGVVEEESVLKRMSDDVGCKYMWSACFVAMRAHEAFIVSSNMWVMLILLWLSARKAQQKLKKSARNHLLKQQEGKECA